MGVHGRRHRGLDLRARRVRDGRRRPAGGLGRAQRPAAVAGAGPGRRQLRRVGRRPAPEPARQLGAARADRHEHERAVQGRARRDAHTDRARPPARLLERLRRDRAGQGGPLLRRRLRARGRQRVRLLHRRARVPRRIGLRRGRLRVRPRRPHPVGAASPAGVRVLRHGLGSGRVPDRLLRRGRARRARDDRVLRRGDAPCRAGPPGPALRRGADPASRLPGRRHRVRAPPRRLPPREPRRDRALDRPRAWRPRLAPVRALHARVRGRRRPDGGADHAARGAHAHEDHPTDPGRRAPARARGGSLRHRHQRLLRGLGDRRARHLAHVHGAHLRARRARRRIPHQRLAPLPLLRRRGQALPERERRRARPPRRVAAGLRGGIDRGLRAGRPRGAGLLQRRARVAAAAGARERSVSFSASAGEARLAAHTAGGL